MTSTPIVPRSWRDENPARRRPSAADAFEASVERYSTTEHKHHYTVCCICPCGLSICTLCGGWQERIEGRIK